VTNVSTLYGGGTIVTMDDAGTEHEHGWVLVDGTTIAAVGSGAEPEADTRVELGGAVVIPGLINTHHHLYQTLTRARAQQADLFTWLRELYPVWSRIDAEAEYAAARTGLAELALSGCTTVFDHHYVFPRGRDGLIEAEVQAARELGVRIVASRGSMDLGVSDGGLPPDELVEELDAVLAETERLAAVVHEPGSGASVQLAVAPCSPFSVTGRLMEESAQLARRLGLPLHTHLAETVEEEAYCVELYGCRPVEYLERLGWLADDVWCAHCVHLSAGDIARFAATGTGVAHCPTSNLRLGAGVDAGAEPEVRGRAVGDPGARRRKAGDVAGREVDAVCAPDIVGEPTEPLEVLDGAAAVELDAVRLLLHGLGEMRVERQAEAARELRRLLHQSTCDRERRAGRDGELHARTRAGLVHDRGETLGLGEHRVELLDELVGWKPAVGDAEIHRAARGDDADTELTRGLHLGLDQTVAPAGKDVVVVEHRRAAGERELCEAGARCRVFRLRVDPRPHRVELAQPGEEVGLLCSRPGERLVEVVVGVDEAGDDDRSTELDPRVRLGLGAATDGGDRRAVDEHPAVLVLGAGIVHRDDGSATVQRGHVRHLGDTDGSVSGRRRATQDRARRALMSAARDATRARLLPFAARSSPSPRTRGSRSHRRSSSRCGARRRAPRRRRRPVRGAGTRAPLPRRRTGRARRSPRPRARAGPPRRRAKPCLGRP